MCCATAATRLFEVGVDEQLIMQRTRHRSSDSVHSYKRVTENLKHVTSHVLNRSTLVQEEHIKPVASLSLGNIEENKENIEDMKPVSLEIKPFTGPVLNIMGSTNVTFTLNFGHN